MSTFDCPFCGISFSLISATFRPKYLTFSDAINYSFGMHSVKREELENAEFCLKIDYIRCPECEEITVIANGISGPLKDKHVHIYPQCICKSFPPYIPEQILGDYQEAAAIIDISPKAAATLFRRCLQGMIRDFWKVKENNLFKEIDAIKDLIQPNHWKAMNGLRRIGNIGAHMEEDVNKMIDVDPDEAQKLRMLIEFLMEDWYIRRHEQEQLCADILEIDQEKQKQRKL